MRRGTGRFAPYERAVAEEVVRQVLGPHRPELAGRLQGLTGEGLDRIDIALGHEHLGKSADRTRDLEVVAERTVQRERFLGVLSSGLEISPEEVRPRSQAERPRFFEPITK